MFLNILFIKQSQREQILSKNVFIGSFFQNVQQLANALCSEKLCESSKIRIFWPRERCSLLRDDVVFVDSPGVDVSPNLDDWIDNHCLDADVFVLVLNAESTMTLAVSLIYFHLFAFI